MVPGLAQKQREIDGFISLDSLRNHRERVDLKSRLLESQCWVGSIFVRDHDPSQGKFARQNVSERDAKTLKFVCLGFLENLIVDYFLKNGQVGLGSSERCDPVSVNGGYDNCSLLLKSCTVGIG